MREILFKAKRIDNGEWIVGDLSHHKTGKVFIKTFNGSATSSCEVDKETICQYTGLTDKNGQKIWENDIVAHTYTTYKEDSTKYPLFSSEQKQKNYVIKADSTDSFLGYRYHNRRNIFPFKKGTVINGSDVVIGNIFDNPELLEVEE